MQQFVNVTLGGLVEGSVFAAFALALVLIWRSTRIVNFAQGSMAAATSFIALALIHAGQSYWVALLVALVAGFVLGGLIERVVVRPVEQGPELNPVIVTLGLFISIEALIALIGGATNQSFPSPFGLQGLKVGNDRIALTPNGIYTMVAVLITMVLLLVLFQYTRVGLAMRASAFGQEVARLLGVRVGRMLTLGWSLAAVVGALSGVLIASNTHLVSPYYMETVIVFGFVAAVLGGLDSPIGAVVGGVLLGLLLNYVSGYLSSDLVNLAALVILMVVLLIRPSGLFSSSVQRRA